ncbi:MAG: SPOR domain-containing protein [Candidatus Rokuibacteriota bacterium]
MRRREPSWSNQTASVLVLLGFVVIVGLVFLAGVLAGRHWPRLLPSLGAASASRVEPEAARRVVERGRPPQPAPVLSFYQDLRAPITADPLPPKPRPSRAARPETPNPETPRPEAVRPQLPEPDPARAVVAARPAAGAAPPERRFTIQVAAFKTRPQAETMRRGLVDGGYDAYVSEGARQSGARYRVRVGVYPTRDDAQQAAQRLAAERRLTTFITAR